MHKDLSRIYKVTHNIMRNIDGLQPQEAFEELLKYLFYRQRAESDSRADEDQAQVRTAFIKYVSSDDNAASAYWHDSSITLSEECLQAVHNTFSGFNLSKTDVDVRGAALKEFLTPAIRKGLGIFLTPDEIVTEMVKLVNPHPTSIVLDPACGSGTFLLEVLKSWTEKGTTTGTVFGIDKNPRMMLLSELNLTFHNSFDFKHILGDTLTLSNKMITGGFPRVGEVDYIFTNPPFGVNVDTSIGAYSEYATAYTLAGTTKKRVPSEILFVEKCLKFLKPGGVLCIVLPRSVFTNKNLEFERSEFGKLGSVESLIALPPETFAVTGAQTNTVVAIIRKHISSAHVGDGHEVRVVNLTNVGYDSTGRQRAGSQLSMITDTLSADSPDDGTLTLQSVHTTKSGSWSILEVSSRHTQESRNTIADLVELVTTGQTPARSAYSDKTGLFLVKVGNLTGSGINWIPRDRNFIDIESKSGSRFKRAMRLLPGDILLTSSAHSPNYIAKKVDIVTEIPEFVGGEASFVGEVMLLRPKQSIISPYRLLAFLRHSRTRATLQSIVRGQTAHLRPEDIRDLPVPDSLLTESIKWLALEELLTAQAKHHDDLNRTCFNELEKLENDSLLDS